MAIKPYEAVAMQTDHRETLGDKKAVMQNIEFWESQLDLHFAFCSFEYPVKLVAFPEGVMQGWLWCLPDLANPTKYARNGAIQVPGPESDRIGEMAKKFNTYIRFQAIATEPEWPDHFFNKSFIVDPKGKVILQTYKHHVSYPIEPSNTPHDLWDEWVQKYVKKDDWKSWMDAFFPVVDTDIGKLGSLICGQTSYPEEGRGLRLNGAEVIIKCNYMNPWTTRPSGSEGNFLLISRMHALVNTCYTVNPNYGTYYIGDVPYTIGGYSLICDYKGEVINQVGAESNVSVAAPIDIEALRQWRQSALGIGTTQIPLLRTEIFRKIYERPIYPINARKEKPFDNMLEVYNALKAVVNDLEKAGINTPPEVSVEGGLESLDKSPYWDHMKKKYGPILKQTGLM